MKTATSCLVVPDLPLSYLWLMTMTLMTMTMMMTQNHDVFFLHACLFWLTTMMTMMTIPRFQMDDDDDDFRFQMTIPHLQMTTKTMPGFQMMTLKMTTSWAEDLRICET